MRFANALTAEQAKGTSKEALELAGKDIQGVRNIPTFLTSLTRTLSLYLFMVKGYVRVGVFERDRSSYSFRYFILGRPIESMSLLIRRSYACLRHREFKWQVRLHHGKLETLRIALFNQSRRA